MLKNNFNFELVTNVISGPYSIKNVYEFLKNKGYNKIGLIIDKNLYKKSKYVRNFIRTFESKTLLKKILYFNEIHEPTYQHLNEVVTKLKEKKNHKFDCLIAIGGGSAIDHAKGIATLKKTFLP